MQLAKKMSFDAGFYELFYLKSWLVSSLGLLSVVPTYVYRLAAIPNMTQITERIKQYRHDLKIIVLEERQQFKKKTNWKVL